MRVLVTGHQGYIGAVLMPMLASDGHEVVGLDTGYFKDCALSPSILPHSALSKDLRDVQVADLEGIDAVIHLAAISNDPLGNLNPECTYDINHRASVKLAALAKKAGVGRFIYSSSCSVYGAASPSDVLDERAEFAPVTPYAESKVWVERDILPLSNDGFSPVFLRNATVYGISPQLRGDLVVNNLVGWAFATGKVLLKSDGTPWRPLVHVEDVCSAFVASLTAPREAIHGQAFNVGRIGENYRIRDVAEIVQKVVKGSNVSFVEGASGDPRCYRVDFSKITNELPGFDPRWTVERGVRQLYGAFQEIGMAQDDLEGPRYLRIKTILGLLEENRIDTELRWIQ